MMLIKIEVDNDCDNSVGGGDNNSDVGGGVVVTATIMTTVMMEVNVISKCK